MIKGVPIPQTPKSDEQVIEELNNTIAKLRMYGLRDIVVEAPSYKLVWSNAAKAWYVAYADGVFQPGDKVTLDANEFLAPYRKDVLTRVVPKLDYLPLYKMSFEAKLRGEYAMD